MKIALITIYQVPNYGSVLQTFASQKILESIGHDCKVIRYQFPNKWHYSQGIPRPNLFRLILKKLGLKAQHRKEIKLQLFRKNFFNFTETFSDFNKLIKFQWENYNAFIVGSDQVWNPRFMKGDGAFLLSFVPQEKKRYSIASSFAQNHLQSKYIEFYKNEISRFDAISVRETNGVNIINNQLGINKNIFVCLDPTLLLNSQEWLNIIPRSKIKKKRPYILFYMWTYAFEPRPYIFEVLNYFKKRLNIYDIIAIEGYTKAKNCMNIKMKNAGDSSIPQFIDLFANADLVITSSFHGTAFALNFLRPLISIIPNNSGDDRQASLLNMVGAQECICHIGQDINSINPYYNIDNVSLNLNKKRLDCINWLKNNIK